MPFGARLDAGQRGLRRLLHHLAEFARQLHAAATVRERRFDLQDFAADFRPRESERESDLAVCGHVLLPEADGAEHLAHAFGVTISLNSSPLFVGHEFARDLAAARADLAFEVADARLARVVADDF